jgi:hypothetical protein
MTTHQRFLVLFFLGTWGLAAGTEDHASPRLKGGENKRFLDTTDDPSAKPGKGWSWFAHSLDPLRSPDDLRLHLPALQGGIRIHVLGGNMFLCQRGMWQGVLGLYRVDGDLAMPSVVLSSGPVCRSFSRASCNVLLQSGMLSTRCLIAFLIRIPFSRMPISRLVSANVGLFAWRPSFDEVHSVQATGAVGDRGFPAPSGPQLLCAGIRLGRLQPPRHFPD